MVWLRQRACLLLLGLLVFSIQFAWASSPVLLTFDTEKTNDAKHLLELNIDVPATYFFLGKFIEKNKDFVKQISQNNTVGSHAYSHANLKDLSKAELHQELLLTKELLEKVTGTSPRWFRAPFLEYNDEILKELKELGFFYDSSEQERWRRQGILYEIPVSGEEGTNNVISDYDVFYREKLSNEDALEWYKQRYLEREKTGRPMVLLLHPEIIVEHKEVLWKFIDFVENEGGQFISSDQWIEKIYVKTLNRIGIWIDLSIGTVNIEQLVADCKKIGISDAFLMAIDYEGHNYFKEINSNGLDIFDDITKALKRNGIKVHAWIPVLLNPKLAQLYPERAMHTENGKVSTSWLSPFNKDVTFQIKKTINKLLTTYDLDGIHLDYIRYPDLAYDYSDNVINGFIEQQEHIKVERTSLLSRHYADWVDWRALGISKLVQNIKETIDQFSHRKIELSAALIAEAAIKAETQAKFGQNYGQLAKFLDLVIPMAYFKGERRTVDWISKVMVSSRYQIGETNLLMGLAAYQQPAEWKITDREFEDTVKIASKGTEGIVFYNYHNLFGHGKEKSWNMNQANVQFLENYLSKKDVFLAKKTPEVKEDMSLLIQIKEIFLNKYSKIIMLVGLFLFLCIFAYIWHYLKKKGLHGQDTSKSNHKQEEIDLAVINFADLDDRVKSGRNISSKIFAEVSSFLNGIGPQRISRFRQLSILELLLEKDRSVNDVLEGVSNNSDAFTGLRRIEEAGLLGYLKIDEHSQVSITELGVKLIKQGQKEGYSTDLINFLDHRLSENIIISCSNCDARTLGHWFWKNYECSGCHYKSKVTDAPNIFIRK